MIPTAYAAIAIGALLSFATSLNVPITVVTHRDKANPFRRSSILFRPQALQTKEKFGGVAGYRPRVRSAYYERVYVHSPEGQFRYRGPVARLQSASCTEFCTIWGNSGDGKTQFVQEICEVRSGHCSNFSFRAQLRSVRRCFLRSCIKPSYPHRLHVTDSYGWTCRQFKNTASHLLYSYAELLA